MSEPSPKKREKIAVIGGGVGAMAAVFFLTDKADWSDRYEISVYQMGWRLGGKGASGRNEDFSQRVEEHGLHIWFGCYHNAIAMIKKAYRMLGRPHGHPFRTWDDAFKPHSLVGLAENINGKWDCWYIDYPRLPGIPGEGGHSMSIRETLLATLRYLENSLFELAGLTGSVFEENFGGFTGHAGVFARFVTGHLPRIFPSFEGIVFTLHGVLKKLLAQGEPLSPLMLRYIKSVVVEVKNQVVVKLHSVLKVNKELRRLFISIDLSVAIIVGVIEDEILDKGFDSINDEDFKAWLIRHGADEEYSVNSAFIRSLYDLVFAYENGDYTKPNLEAGTMLRAILRMTECYSDAFMYKMQGGMGDVVFEPLYTLLKERGVNFHFFSEVVDMVPSSSSVEEIVIRQQVILGDVCREYHPLVSVNGVDCWPSKPNFSQMTGWYLPILEQKYYALENAPNEWAKLYSYVSGELLPETKLVRGVDFDSVIFGASLASLPIVADKLVAADVAIQNSVEKVKTNATQAFQVWNDQSLRDLGWNEKYDEQPVVSGFVKPFDTWAPMDHLVDVECWKGVVPKSLFYHCNVFPKQDEGTQQESDEKARENIRSFLSKDVSALVPNFSYSPEAYPEEKFYSRVNQYASERYVVSHVGTSKYRIKTDGSKFDNLYFVGDWIDTGINIGCVEAATMSGMMAARAISGSPERIVGEFDFNVK